MTRKTEAYGLELTKKMDVKNNRRQKEGKEGRKGLSQGVRQKGADTWSKLILADKSIHHVDDTFNSQWQPVEGNEFSVSEAVMFDNMH